MKIGLIIASLERGGAERQVLLSAIALKELGHDVRVIIYHPHNDYTDIVGSGGIDIVQIDSKGFLRMGRIAALVSHSKRESYDVIHAFSGSASIYAALAGKLAHVPVVLGGYRVEYKEKVPLKWVHKWIDHLLTGWIVNSGAIADSMSTRAGINSARFNIVYNGIMQGAFQSHLSKMEAKIKLEIPANCQVVSKIAQLRPQKNHKLFLDSASLVLEQLPQTHFLVVGGGALLGELRDYARQKGISQKVSFLGNRTDISDILAATDISVLTSDFEGFPNALIEAMSVGIAVVTTDYPGVEELVTDGKEAMVAPLNNAPAFSEKVIRLLKDPQLRKSTGNAGMQMVKERLSLPTLAKKLVTVYSTALNQKQ